MSKIIRCDNCQVVLQDLANDNSDGDLELEALTWFRLYNHAWSGFEQHACSAKCVHGLAKKLAL